VRLRKTELRSIINEVLVEAKKTSDTFDAGKALDVVTRSTDIRWWEGTKSPTLQRGVNNGGECTVAQITAAIKKLNTDFAKLEKTIAKLDGLSVSKVGSPSVFSDDTVITVGTGIKFSGKNASALNKEFKDITY